MIWILGNPEFLWSVADRFNITKSILFRVYRRICEAINNNLSGQYMKYLLVWNWAPLGKMINFISFAQRNALDHWSNDLSLDHTDQWFDESLSRVDLIDHWSENGFAWKEHHGSEILIWILPKECTLNRGTSPGCLAGDLISPKDFDKIQILLNEKRSCVVVLCDLPKGRNLWSKWFIYYHFDLFHLQKQDVNSSNLNDNK